MRADRLTTAVISIALALTFAGCASVGAATPDSELRAYAQEVGAKWHPQGLLVGGKLGLDFDRLRALSAGALSRIETIIVSREPSTPNVRMTSVPDLHFLPSLKRVQFPSVGLRRADGLSGLQLRFLDLSGNPLNDIRFLATMLQVEDVNLAGTGITSLPDLSGLAKLRGLTIAETPIRSLNNLETVRSDFDLDVWGCDQLDDIDALLYARVRTLTIDENNYERLRDWFASHLSEIKAKRKFSVEFQLPSRE